MNAEVHESPMGQQNAARHARASLAYDSSPRGRAAQELASALDEAYFAQERFRLRRPVLGMHGENYEHRWVRVRGIVTAHNNRMIKLAQKRAIKVGWSERELRSSGLDLPR